MIGLLKRIAVAVGFLCLAAGASEASTFTIPSNKLTPSVQQYYTDLIGPELLMTGGGANANVGFAPNDDGFAEIQLGFVFSLFGTDYTKLFANNNGNVSFGRGLDAWQAGDLASLGAPVIAPFFGDVDTFGVADDGTHPVTSGVMHLRNDIPNEIIITWDGVGYYNGHTDKLNSFQLVLRGPDFVVPAGEGQVGFFYKSMAWETGDGPGSGGSGDIGAAIGFADGIHIDDVVLEFSLLPGIAGVVSDQHIWFNRDDVATPGLFRAAPQAPEVPEPATLLLVGTGAAFLGRKLYSRKRQA